MHSDQERFEREQQLRRQRFEGCEPSGPHGGPLETMAKVAFFALALVLASAGLHRATLMADRSLGLSAEDRVALMERAEAIHRQFAAKGGNWLVAEAAGARGGLLAIRNRFDHFNKVEEPFYRRVQRLVEDVVVKAKAERYAVAERAAAGKERALALWQMSELQQAFDVPIGNREFQQVDALGNKMWLPKAKAEERPKLVGVLEFGGLLYLLFMPFALLSFLARMQKFGMSVREELVFGWQNLLGSVVFWPFAMGSYPRSTARELRRMVVTVEYMARTGRGKRGDLTAQEFRDIEALVEVPFVELRRRLAEIQQIPAEALLRARFAVYAAMLVAFLIGPFSSLAKAQSRSGGAMEKAVAAEAVGLPEFELHGFLHGEGGGPAVPFGIKRLWLIGDARPHHAVQLRVIPNLVGSDGQPVLVGAFAVVKVAGTPFGIRAGQFAQRGADAVPRPDKERLIGGPGAGGLVTFFEPGAEVFGEHGRVGWSLAAISGSGQNVPDANAAKDVVASVASGPWGPLRFRLVCQAGEQSDGFRTRSAANVVGNFGAVIVDALGTHERFGDVDSFAASALVGWRAHNLVDLAAGYDELRLANADPDHVARAQATLHLFDGTVQLGAQYRASKSAGHQGLGRLQVSF